MKANVKKWQLYFLFSQFITMKKLNNIFFETKNGYTLFLLVIPDIAYCSMSNRQLYGFDIHFSLKTYTTAQKTYRDLEQCY